MQRLAFEWVYFPAIVAVAAVVAVGLLLTLMHLQGLPTWFYTLPAVPAVGVYYVIKLRKLWHQEVKPGFTANVGGQVGNQKVDRGSVAPVVKGRGNSVTIHMPGAPYPDAGRLNQKPSNAPMALLARPGTDGSDELGASCRATGQAVSELPKTPDGFARFKREHLASVCAIKVGLEQLNYPVPGNIAAAARDGITGQHLGLVGVELLQTAARLGTRRVVASAGAKQEVP